MDPLPVHTEMQPLGKCGFELDRLYHHAHMDICLTIQTMSLELYNRGYDPPWYYARLTEVC